MGSSIYVGIPRLYRKYDTAGDKPECYTSTEICHSLELGLLVQKYSISSSILSVQILLTNVAQKNHDFIQIMYNTSY